MAGRKRKPAKLKKGKSETKAHLKERAEVEDKLKGKDNLVYNNIPSGLDELGKKYYKFMVDELEEIHILANLDIPIITQTADVLSKLEQVDNVINQEGLFVIVMDKMGNNIIKEHPAINIKMKYLAQFRGLAGQLGLSPSARAQLAEMKMADKEQEEDPMVQLIKMRTE